MSKPDRFSKTVRMTVSNGSSLVHPVVLMGVGKRQFLDLQPHSDTDINNFRTKKLDTNPDID